ncbi:MAG: 4Fe-4S dicluster domain-containing protein [Elusimicrobiota bacterium]|nr:4Fe-4S dicluster domain-containing protein [Elusimicrobiota bacterium]
MKLLFVEPKNCVGCRVCELICSFKHFSCFKRTLSAVAIIKYDEYSRDIPMVCQQCEDAPCANVCKVKAINKNSQTGAWEIDYTKCIGCKLCVSACPFGQVFFDDEGRDGRGIPVKCDLCSSEPKCVEICPSEALIYSEPDKALLSKRRFVIEKSAGGIF